MLLVSVVVDSLEGVGYIYCVYELLCLVDSILKSAREAHLVLSQFYVELIDCNNIRVMC